MKTKLITRIKVVEKFNGDKLYIPECYEFLLGNLIFKIIFCLPEFLIHLVTLELGKFFKTYFKREWNEIYTFSNGMVAISIHKEDKMECKSIEEAQNAIIKYIKRCEEEKAVIEAQRHENELNNIKKTTYIKFP